MYVKRSSRFEAHSRRHRKDFVAAPIATENGHRIESIVAGIPLFRGLGRQNVVALAGAARLANARRGASLARRGEPMPGVIAVAEGMLKLALRGSGGAERVLRFVGPGETFGEAAVLLSRPSAVDAVALADTLFVVLPAASIRGLMGRHAPFARLQQEHRVIAQAGEKLRELLSAALDGAIIPRAEIEVAAAMYLVYYGNHIAHEEEDILGRAERALTAEDWQAVKDAA